MLNFLLVLLGLVLALVGLGSVIFALYAFMQPGGAPGAAILNVVGLLLMAAALLCLALPADAAVSQMDSVWQQISMDIQDLSADLKPSVSIDINQEFRNLAEALIQEKEIEIDFDFGRQLVHQTLPEPVIMPAQASANIHVDPNNPRHVDYLACVIYQEVGSNHWDDESHFMVADIVLNRVEDERFPDTIHEVLTARNQFGRFHWTGVVWPDKHTHPVEQQEVARCKDIARRALSGEHSHIYGKGYVWMAKFRQGRDHIRKANMWFAR